MFAGRILAGGLLLVLGRKLFWLFVAILGFAAGLTVAARLFHVQPEWLQLVIAIAVGILGALLAYFLEKIAIAVSGFLGGAYIATSLAISLAGNMEPKGDVLSWVFFIVGGIVGAVLAVMLFDWALIILSSLAGALLVMEGLKLTGPVGWLIALGLFIVGIVIQSRINKPPRRTNTIPTRTT